MIERIMLDNLCIIIEDKALYEAITSRLKVSISAVCGKCGTVICDAMKLAKELDDIISKTFDDKEATSINDEAHTILAAIIEMEPSFDSMTSNEWIKWDAENENRKCKFLTGYEYPVYVKCSQVCLINNENCDCFGEIKKIHSA